MTAETDTRTGGAAEAAGIWRTWRESAPAVKAILLGIFVNRVGAFFQTFLVLFLTHRGFTEGQAGVALGGYGAGSMLGVLVGGALADRLGARVATLLSMGGSAVMLIAVLYVRAFPVLLAAVVLVGIIGQFYRPASATLLSALTPPERQVMTFALYRWALNVGTTAAPLLGAGLILISYSLLFWAEAIASLCYAVIAAIALPTRAAERSIATEDRAEAGTGYLAVLRDRRYVLYLLAVLINSVVYIQYVSTLPLTMKDAGLATVWFAIVVALNGAIVISCELLVTKVVQRWPMRITVAVAFALLGGGLSLYALPWGVGIFIAGTLVWTLAEIVGGPSVFAYPGIAAPARLRGRYIGSMQLMFSLGTAIGPPLGVALYLAAGRAVWWCCGLACLAGAVLVVAGMVRTPAAVQAQVPVPSGSEKQ